MLGGCCGGVFNDFAVNKRSDWGGVYGDGGGQELHQTELNIEAGKKVGLGWVIRRLNQWGPTVGPAFVGG